jgi:hypothetical protein
LRGWTAALLWLLFDRDFDAKERQFLFSSAAIAVLDGGQGDDDDDEN